MDQVQGASHLAKYCVSILAGRRTFGVPLERFGRDEQQGGRPFEEDPGTFDLRTPPLLFGAILALTLNLQCNDEQILCALKEQEIMKGFLQN